MRYYYLVSAALAAAVVSAPAVAGEHAFEGFYVGVNGGVVWSDSTAQATLASTSSAPVVAPPIVGGSVTSINQSADFNSKHHTGFTGGLEAGYNYVSNHNGLLLGFETDLNIYDMTGTGTGVATSGATTYTLTQKMDTNWLWTMRPKVGYAGGSFDVYATGGLALTSVKYHASFTDSSTAADNILVDHNKSKTGWTIGAGAGYAFSNSISVKGEYLFQNYGKENGTGTSTNGFYTLSAEEHLKSHLFRVGLDYNF